MQTKSMVVREQNWLCTIRQVAESGITTKQWCAEHGVTCCPGVSICSIGLAGNEIYFERLLLMSLSEKNA